MATLFGVGRVGVIPGTIGTIASIPLVYVADRFLPTWGYIVTTVLVAAVAIAVSGAAARALGQNDPRQVVIDETAGLFVTFIALPVDAARLAVGFLLFRVADILKPQPARRAERLPGGWGIVTDDLVAGLYANLSLRLVWFLWERATT